MPKPARKLKLKLTSEDEKIEFPSAKFRAEQRKDMAVEDSLPQNQSDYENSIVEQIPSTRKEKMPYSLNHIFMEELHLA